MTSLVWVGGFRFRYEEGPRPSSIPAGHVLIRPTAVGICATDIHIIEGRLRVAQPPLVLGHEIAGVVEAVGGDVSQLKPGDRVTVDQVIGCGHCFFCQKGSRQFCKSGFEMGITGDGGCRSFLIVPQANAFVVPPTISDEVAAVLDMEVWAAISKCGVVPGDTVLVLGPGPAGLVACQVARLLGAGSVILAGPRGSRMAKAQTLGLADCYIFSDSEDVVARVVNETGGFGANVAIECSGAEQALLNALNAVMPSGRIVLYGLQSAPLSPFDTNTIVLRDLVVFGALSDRLGWEQIIELVSTGKLLLAPLITHRFSFREAPAAYEYVRQRPDGLVKAVITL